MSNLKKPMSFRSSDGSFSVLAEDDTRIFIWYETAGQGAWLSRKDALFLKMVIEQWENQETE